MGETNVATSPAKASPSVSDDEIAGVATRVRDLAEETEEVRVAFNNNYSLYAPKAALL